MTYKLSTDEAMVQRDNGDGSFTFINLAITTTQAFLDYQAWLAEGNEPLPADEID